MNRLSGSRTDAQCKSLISRGTRVLDKSHQGHLGITLVSLASYLRSFVIPVMVGILSGCATELKPEPVPVPDITYQRTLGNMAVEAVDKPPEIRLTGYTHGKGEGARHLSSSAMKRCVNELTTGTGKDAAVGILLIPFICPLVGLGGAAAGAIKAPSAAEVKTYEHSILTNTNTDKVQDKLRDEVLAEALRSGNSVKPFAKLEIVTNSHQKHAGQTVGSVLEVRLEKVILHDSGGIDPNLTLEMQAHVRLMRAQNDKQLLAADYVYTQGRWKLSEWAANKAVSFRKALDAGYKALGSRIYDNLFLLYPFPNRDLSHNGTYTFGLAPEEPTIEGNDSWPKVKSLEPTLRWQRFPRHADIQDAPQIMKQVTHVRYDLVIARVVEVAHHHYLPAWISYRRSGLKTNECKVTIPLEERAKFLWSVRAHFELNGRERVTEWGSMLPPRDTKINYAKHKKLTVPSEYSYRFETPSK